MVSETLEKTEVATSTQPDSDKLRFEYRNLSRAQLLSAGRFMFAKESLDTEVMEECAIS